MQEYFKRPQSFLKNIDVCIFVLESQPLFKPVKQDKNDDENFNQLWEVKMFGASLREEAVGRRQSFGKNKTW